MEPLLVARDRFIDDARRNLALLPAHNLDSPTLEILVDMEEMLHFLQIMLGKVGDVEILVVIRIVARDRQNLVVGLAAIQHLENTDGPAVDLAARKRRLVDVNEDVEWVSIEVQRTGDETIVSRIMHRRVEHAVEPDHAGGFVELVFVSAPARHLDHRRHVVRQVDARRQIVPGIDDHVLTRSIVPLYLMGSSSTPKFPAASSAMRSICAGVRSGLSAASANSRSCSMS